MNRDDAKRLAAEAALEFLPEEGVIGLGSGSTARLFIDGVGALVKAGRKLRGVPTSEESRSQAERLGIELLPDAGPWSIDVCVDGADEVSEALDLIKGGGGCHTREKVVSHASRRNVIVVDDSKLSKSLGEKWPVPVEILPFGHASTVRALGAFGRVAERLKKGAPWITDAGNPIYDVHAGVIPDPAALDRCLRAIPGVVETGLFVKRADLVLVAGETGVTRLGRSDFQA
jgi:ribose 5-phosphate isomerase A